MGLLRTQSTLLAAAEGIDVHVGQVAQRLDAVEDRQDAQAAEVEEGRCRCGTLIGSVPETAGPGSAFEGFEGPRPGTADESADEMSPVGSVSGFRTWASIREVEPALERSSAEAEALDWVARHPLRSPSPGWDADDLDAAIAAFPELL
jgi:hypothetical protein